MWLELQERWNDLRYRVRSLARRDDLERELHAELEAHLEREAETYERRGVATDEARRLARVTFGGIEDIREATRVELGTAFVESITSDIRRALRGFRARPGWTSAIGLTLALGIGVNVAAFAIVKGVLLTPLPYPDADRLVAIWATVDDDASRLQATVPEYVAWRDRTHVFEDVSTYGYVMADLAGEDGSGAEAVRTQQCSASLFRALRVPPELGRTFTDAETPIDGRASVAVITYRLWQRRFHGDPRVLEQRVRIDDGVYTIVGVMPASFVSGNEIDVLVPLVLNRNRLRGSARGWPVIARLKPGVSIDEAQADANAVSVRLGAERDERLGAIVQPFWVAQRGSLGRPLAVLEGIVAVVLLLACTNVSGLLLARTIARRADLLVRWAIGAGRARLIRQLLIESVLLAGVGGCLSMAVAWLALDVLVAKGPLILPAASTTLDGRVTVFAVALSMAVGVLLGLTPAAYVWRADFGEALRSSSRAVWEPRRVRRLRGALVATQIAAALTLLVNAGLLVNTFVRLTVNPLGGDPAAVASFTMQFAPARYQTIVGSRGGLPLLDFSPEPARRAAEISRRLRAMPGVLDAAVVNHVPFVEAGPLRSIDIGDGARADAGGPRARIYVVTPHFFATVRMPVVRGRDFDARDTPDGPLVAIVSETLARTLWGSRSPIGERIRVATDDRAREIVGVVVDSRVNPQERAVTPMIYTPLGQQPAQDVAPNTGEYLLMTVVFRTARDPLAAAAAVQTIVADVDPGRPPVDIHLLERDLSRVLEAWTYFASAMTTFAVIAMLLAAIGVYGVVAHAMAQRARELAIRRALGAGQWDVWRLAIGYIGWFLACGLACGMAAAAASTRLIQGALWGVTPTDAPTYTIAALLMIAATCGAIVLPVRRVLREAPAAALKVE
jgi:putative ABC transport system permease protein